MAVLVTMSWGLWDLYPFFMLDNGYKQWKSLLVDSLWAGGIWFFTSLFIVNNYYSLLKQNIFTLIIIFIVTVLYFHYYYYIYNREGTENNWLVKLGDKLKLDKYCPPMRTITTISKYFN